MKPKQELGTVARQVISALDRALDMHEAELRVEEVGAIVSVGSSTVHIRGLPRAQSEELIRLADGRMGMAFNLNPDEIGVVLLDRNEGLYAGMQAYRTGRVADIPVGDALVGRVISALGQPLDGRGPLTTVERLPIERSAPAIMDRAPVQEPLQTGIKVIDALFPIGRGQRELIVGDRQTGKTAIALDAIINQRDKDVICIYCAIGQRNSSVAKVISDLQQHDAMDYTIVVLATGHDMPGLQYAAPYAATSIGEYFMEQGRDVLIVYDDLTHHARAYRELSLLLRRPPGREAFPGDIFYIHSRLLERSTRLHADLGGGSMTALPIIETEAQNLSAYIPTNLISITDGQIYLSPTLFQRGVLPAVDIGRSVSRVGGKAQLPAFRAVAGDLRLSYAQFEELEAFSRFGTQLDKETRRTIERGHRVREMLKQSLYRPLAAADQIAVLLAVTEGALDDLPPDRIADAEQAIRAAAAEQHPNLYEKIGERQALEETDQAALLETIEEALAAIRESNNGNA